MAVPSIGERGRDLKMLRFCPALTCRQPDCGESGTTGPNRVGGANGALFSWGGGRVASIGRGIAINQQESTQLMHAGGRPPGSGISQSTIPGRLRVVSVVIFHPGGSGRAALYMQGRALVSSGECRVASSREVAVGSRVAGRRSVVHGDPRLAVRVAAALRAALRVAVRTRQTCLSTSHDEKARSRGFLSRLRSPGSPGLQVTVSAIASLLAAPGRPLGLEHGRVPNRSHQAARQLGRCLRICWTPPAFESHFKNWPCRTSYYVRPREAGLRKFV